VVVAAKLQWNAAPLTGNLKCTILHVHDRDRPALDDDNMVKPIRDALNKVVYEDDRQIRYSETIYLPMDTPVVIRASSAILLAAYSAGRPFVYVRIEDAPTVIHLPGA
jgi:crossover junction endodeoxyribonuclease RusA